MEVTKVFIRVYSDNVCSVYTCTTQHIAMQNVYLFCTQASRAGSVATARLMLESALLHLSPSSSLTADVAAKALLDKHSLPACSLRLRGMAKEARQGTVLSRNIWDFGLSDETCIQATSQREILLLCGSH